MGVLGRDLAKKNRLAVAQREFWNRYTIASLSGMPTGTFVADLYEQLARWQTKKLTPEEEQYAL